MVHDPILLILILLAVEIGILALAANPRTKFLFSFLPSMFWIYFVPMLLSTAGIIDPKSPVYAQITKYLLPPALFLLLLHVEIKAISRLGPQALIMFFAGSVGIMIGMVVSFMLFKSVVGPQFWGGFGALAASWTGGSANMVAVKEALNVPDHVFMPMVIVDTVVPYTWLGILVALASRQKTFDTWNHADRRILDDLAKKVTALGKETKQVIDPVKAVGFIGLALVVGQICRFFSVYFPTGKDIITPAAWTIILISTLSLLLSATPLSRIKHTGSNKTGKWILYFVLTSIGARASLQDASQAGILIAAGALVVLIHAVILLATARIIKAPLFLVVTASLANMAGLVSAPMIAEVYQPGLASVGLILAILGHSLGAYIGIFIGQICHFLR